jgi:hypothetical protein
LGVVWGYFDRKHNFVMTNVWDLPFGKGRSLFSNVGSVVDRLVGGWSLAAITSWSSGLPFTPTYRGAECTADIGMSPFRPCFPNLVGTVHITGDRNQWFTTTGRQKLLAGTFNNITGEVTAGQAIGPWQRPAPGQIGDAGRNVLRGPGFFQSDLAVAKNVPITERVAVQFRADVFNLFNKVNLRNPVAAVDAPNAGQITSSAIGSVQRRIQFSLRANF